jgi:membrane protease YdiL (CAAX protease family)
MQLRFYKSAGFWFFLLAAIPFWLCLIVFFDLESNLNWFREHLLTYLYVGLLLPIVEEIVFRGFIQEQFAKHFGDRGLGVLSYANILTSVVFCVLHFVYHPPLWAVMVLIPSLIFGYFKDQYKSLAAPIILHVFYNAGYFLIFGATTSLTAI